MSGPPDYETFGHLTFGMWRKKLFAAVRGRGGPDEWAAPPLAYRDWYESGLSYQWASDRVLRLVRPDLFATVTNGN